MADKILRLLRQEGSFVSGEQISSELHITRSAVWKRIRTLRKKGFVIQAVPSKGYKLIGSPDLSKDEIEANISPDFWRAVYFFDSVDSTNERAAELSMQDSPVSGDVIIADSQEKGKGRLGREWISPPGVNVYMSIVLKPEMEPRRIPLLTALAAVACASALGKRTGQAVSIKWPNDLILNDKKIGGILAEARSDPDKITMAIIGIGVNVNSERKEFPEEIRDRASSIRQETGKYYSRSSIISHILNEFEVFYRDFHSEGSGQLLTIVRKLSSTIGKHVRVTAGNETVSGTAEDIDDEGLLVLRLSSGIQKRISAGDIVHVR